MASRHSPSAISPQRVLFVTEPGMGHVHPLLPVMHTLQAGGHAVALATSQLYQERIEREGLASYPLGPHYSEERLEEFFPLIRYLRLHYLRVSYDFLRIFMASVPSRIPELRRIAQDFQPTVVVAGPLTFAAQLFCEQQTLPWAVLSPMTHFMTPSLHAPPAGFPRVETLPPAWHRPYRLGLSGAIRIATALMAPWRRALNRYRRQLGLPPHTDPLSPHVLAPFLLIHTCSREYDYNRPDLPPQVHYVGPTVWDRPVDWRAPDWLGQLPTNKPLVYVSLGTVFNTRLGVFRKIIRALGQLDVLGLVVTGPGCPPGLFSAVPPNVRVEAYIPQTALQAELKTRPALIISHGGVNTVMTALSHGIPLLCIPLGADQPDNAQRCVDAGAGLRLDRRLLTTARLTRAIRTLLSQDSFSRQARKMQHTLRRHNGPEEAAALIVRLAETRAPVYRPLTSQPA